MPTRPRRWPRVGACGGLGPHPAPSRFRGLRPCPRRGSAPDPAPQSPEGLELRALIGLTPLTEGALPLDGRTLERPEAGRGFRPRVREGPVSATRLRPGSRTPARYPRQAEAKGHSPCRAAKPHIGCSRKERHGRRLRPAQTPSRRPRQAEAKGHSPCRAAEPHIGCSGKGRGGDNPGRARAPFRCPGPAGVRGGAPW
ncbi:hypothetical protein SVIO_062360 [Streptomyces violaceusniger]|uniref:Uncharacterized protein n=1 Tax=Streptomyces violaceusniger TaxID=68280 RepID=A0A4D4LC00_STRVO|nr:hypothetical protein SVIO_062360 [Streptomyces violaceusniger]